MSVFVDKVIEKFEFLKRKYGFSFNMKNENEVVFKNEEVKIGVKVRYKSDKERVIFLCSKLVNSDLPDERYDDITPWLPHSAQVEGRNGEDLGDRLAEAMEEYADYLRKYASSLLKGKTFSDRVADAFDILIEKYGFEIVSSYSDGLSKRVQLSNAFVTLTVSLDVRDGKITTFLLPKSTDLHDNEEDEYFFRSAIVDDIIDIRASVQPPKSSGVYGDKEQHQVMRKYAKLLVEHAPDVLMGHTEIYEKARERRARRGL